MDSLFLLFVAFCAWIIMVCFGMYVSSQKGRGSVEGALFAIFLGPLGILITALLPNRQPSSHGRQKGFRSSPEYEAMKQEAIDRYKIKKASRGD